MPTRLGIMSFAHLHAFSYATALNELAGVEFVGIWDDDPARGAAMSGEYGVPFFAEAEELLAEVFVRLRERFPDLFLVLVPRHFERGREVGRELEKRGVKFMYRREITVHTALPERSLHCLLVNTTGELKYFYEEADVVFVGKSLTAQGGQNPIEPATLGRAMVFGPHMQNFAAISRAFVEADAAIQVPDAAALEQAIADLLADPERRERMGQRAIQVVRENTGALERTIQMIINHLPEEETYVAPVARMD